MTEFAIYGMAVKLLRTQFEIWRQAMDTLNNMQDNLANLSTSELQQVIQLAKNLQATKNSRDEAVEVTVFFESLCAELKLHTTFDNPPLAIYRGRDRKGYQKILESVAMVDTWAGALAVDSQTLLKKRNIYAVLAMLVSSYLDEIGVPVTLKTLLNSFHKFPSLIDAAFPGYAQSGLLHMVFARSRQDTLAA